MIKLTNLPGHPEGEFLLACSWELDKHRTHPSPCLATAGKVCFGLSWNYISCAALGFKFPAVLIPTAAPVTPQKPAQLFPAHKNQGKAGLQPITNPDNSCVHPLFLSLL